VWDVSGVQVLLAVPGFCQAASVSHDKVAEPGVPGQNASLLNELVNHEKIRIGVLHSTLSQGSACFTFTRNKNTNNNNNDNDNTCFTTCFEVSAKFGIPANMIRRSS
jgi:hypothetical protein